MINLLSKSVVTLLDNLESAKSVIDLRGSSFSKVFCGFRGLGTGATEYTCLATVVCLFGGTVQARLPAGHRYANPNSGNDADDLVSVFSEATDPGPGALTIVSAQLAGSTLSILNLFPFEIDFPCDQIVLDLDKLISRNPASTVYTASYLAAVDGFPEVEP